MKKIASLIVLVALLVNSTGCSQDHVKEAVNKDTTAKIAVQKIIIDQQDSVYGYYLAFVPKNNITGVLLLFPGFGQIAETVFPETKLENVANDNNILTIVIAEGNKLYADSPVQKKITAALKDVINRYKVSPEKFVLGGFSAGGMVALRYTELCNQYPENFPIKPKGVFMVDSPIDIFKTWDDLEEFARDKHSEMAVEEAERAMREIKNDHGVPKENIPFYASINAFSMNKAYGENEQHLKTTAVRAYHDVDIAWRLTNRNQTVRHSNFLATSELINRLMLMGNKKAEFIQTYKTGYRSNGQRHPHSWSIVDETECIKWIKTLL